MEVHSHTHTARKKWTHYFWEFLMLFLAVFAGFMAENQREHFIEHKREKKFAKNLLSDLRADSAFFVKRTRSIEDVLRKHQLFYDLMTGPVKPGDKEILSASFPLFYTFDVQVNTATYNQMKTSGSLRYIRNDELTAQLQQYYEVSLPRTERGAQMEYDYYTQILNPFIIKHIRAQDFDFIGDTLKTSTPVFMDRTDRTDQEFLNIVENYAGSHRVVYERLLLPAAKKLNEVILLLKKEYHLK